jgi:hypothetical protein
MSQEPVEEQEPDQIISSSSVGPGLVNFEIQPIFSQPRLEPALRRAKVVEKMDALDLSIEIKKQNKFINYGKLDAKAGKAKDLEDEIEKNKEEPIEEDETYPRSSYLAKRLMDVDPGLDFMDSEKRERLLSLYSQDPKALPSKEVKPLKYSELDRFANNIEINLAAAGNAQVEALEALEHRDMDLGFYHLKNSTEFIRNAHELSNLERLKLRDPSSANAIKSHIEGAD